LTPDDSRALTMGACALCRLGEEAKGLAWARQALDIDPGDPGVAYNVACVYAVAQRHDEAIEALTQAVDHGFGNVEWVAHDPDWASLKGHPRFEALLRDQSGCGDAGP